MTPSWSSSHRFSSHHLGILGEIATLSEKGGAFTLCMVVHTSGSTYRKAGAMAVVADDGARHGVISGGCLESELETAAALALAEHRARLLVFDTDRDDDVIFGSGSGCRGRAQVLLLPIASGTRHPLCEAMLTAERAHEVLTAALVTRGAGLGGGFAWHQGSEVALSPPIESVRALRSCAAGEYELADQSTCAVLQIKPSPRIMLVGAGPESPSLISLAAQLGWHVTICDHREELLRRHALGAETAICARPAAALAQTDERTFDACIVMTHTAASDREALTALAALTVPFIGLLGPAQRRDELLREIDASASSALRGRLHAPVGIRLGGHGPEVLALSVCAELQRFLTARVGAQTLAAEPSAAGQRSA
jgi:xanthine dehydrogenase accessory factor